MPRAKFGGSAAAKAELQANKCANLVLHKLTALSDVSNSYMLFVLTTSASKMAGIVSLSESNNKPTPLQDSCIVDAHISIATALPMMSTIQI